MADPHDDRLDRRRFGVAGLQTLLAAAGATLLSPAATAAGAAAGAGTTSTGRRGFDEVSTKYMEQARKYIPDVLAWGA